MKKILITAFVLSLASTTAMAGPRVGHGYDKDADVDVDNTEKRQHAKKRQYMRGLFNSPFMSTLIVLKRADTNHDRKVDMEEWIAIKTAAAERRFERLDKDESNTLTLEEFAKIKSRIRAFKTEHGDEVRACVDEAREAGEEIPQLPNIDKVADIETVFGNKDTNNDEVLDLAEFTAAALTRASRIFNKLDHNEDGYIQPGELIRMIQKVKLVRKAIAACMNEGEDPIDELDDLDDGLEGALEEA